MNEGDEAGKRALVIMGEFIAEKLIEEAEPERWQLTSAGVVEANKVMKGLPHKEQALVLLLADSIIRKGDE